MKRRILISLILLSSILTINAQSWSSSTPGIIYYNQGQVGIGLNDPDYRLTVDNYIKVKNSGEIGYLWGNPANLWNLYKPSGSSDLRLLSYNGGQYVMTFKSDNGYVGIGTTTPLAKLWISHASIGSTTLTAFENTDFTDGNRSAIRIRQATGVGVGYSAYLGVDLKSHNVFLSNDDINLNQLVIQNSTGNIGFGTNNPNYSLDIFKQLDGLSMINIQNISEAIGSGSGIRFYTRNQGGGGSWWSNIALKSDSKLHFNMEQKEDAMVIDQQGFVGIGMVAPAYKLDVNGTIHAREVKIDINFTPADYVFKPEYKLLTLIEVEEFIRINNHLPEIPSASETKENGLNMGEMQNKLLQKIEEMTLYIIDQNKKLEQQNSKIQALESEINELRTK